MADLKSKKLEVSKEAKEDVKCTMECYSERGILSWFFFRHLVKLENFQALLEKVFPEEKLEVIKDIREYAVFSEFVLGSVGFGNPDGALYFDTGEKDNKGKYFIFFEGKLNESYSDSCTNKPDKYNSSIKGQIELKWRFIEALSEVNYGVDRIQETKNTKEAYGVGGENPVVDIFYEKRQGKDYEYIFRHVLLKDGVKKLYESYLKYVHSDNFYVLISTKENTNPFTSSNIEWPWFPDIRDELEVEGGKKICPSADRKNHLLWLPAEYITGKLE